MDKYKDQMASNVSIDGSDENLQSNFRSILVLIEPCLLTRQCMLFWLEHRVDDLDLVAFETPEAAIESTSREAAADLVIWSVGSQSMASGHFQQQLHDLKTRFPLSPIVFFADSEDPDDVTKAMRLGVKAYVPTSCDREEVWEILRFIRAGGTYVPASILGVAEEHNERTPSRPSSKTVIKSNAIKDLTPRELDVVERLRQGKPNKIIAHELQISESTVKVFVHRILTKLGAINRTEVAYLFQD